MGHIVSIADIGHANSPDFSGLFKDKRKVRQRLARVMAVREAIDDRNPRFLGEPFNPVMTESPDYDQVQVSGHDPGRILDRLSTGQLGVASHENGVPSHLMNARLKGESCAR